MSHRHALVIGKFYPPTLGHHALVRHASAHADRVTVVVMAAAQESVSLSDRIAWLTAEHAVDGNVVVTGIRCDIPTDMESPTVWTAQVALMAAALSAATDEPVDVVVSSEAYGPPLAQRLGCDSLAFDPAREAVSVAATHVRLDLPGHWHLLSAPVRAGLAARVVVVGAESTGTTTIAELITRRVRDRGGVWAQTQLVQEYGREYSEVKSSLDALVWSPADFDAVAQEQTARENTAAAAGSPLLVCDNDALAAVVWERRYLGQPRSAPPPWAVPPELPRHDLYLVTDHDGVPWEQDGLREGDLEVRAAMTGWFCETLTAYGQSWALLTGSLDERLDLAMRCVDLVLSDRLHFAAARDQAPSA